MRRCISLLAVLPALLIPIRARAQDSTTARGWVSDRWTTDNGLPQNSIQEIIQSHDGYLWLATNGGVTRFDGVAFTNFSSGTRRGLNSDRVLNVAESVDHHIWAGTENGLSRFDGDRFRTWTTADGMPGNAISALTPHPRGGVIFGTRNGALGTVVDSTIRVVFPAHGILGDPVSRIVIDSAGDVWVWSHKGIWLVDLEKGTARQMRAPRRATATAPMRADRRAGVWVATDDGVVHITRSGTANYPIRRLLGDPKKMCTPGPDCGPWADGVDLTSLAIYDKHTFALGTRMGEVWLFHPDSMGTPGAVRRIEKNERGSTNTVMVDREHNIWSGTTLTGLVRTRPGLVQVYTAADGLVNDVLEAVFTDRDGRVWVGGNCNGVAVRDGATFRRFGHADGMPNDCVWSIEQDTSGAIWTGTYGGGVGRWVNNRIARWYTTADGLPSNVVLSMMRDRRGTLWIGTDRGVATWDGAHFTDVDLGIRDFTGDVRMIVEARDGSFWFGTVGGLVHYVNGVSTLHTRRNGLPNDFVRAIHEDADGTLWGGTYGGGMFRLRNGVFTSFTSADGLFDNFISTIIVDERNNFWMSTNRGIFRVSRSALEAFAAGKLPRIPSVAYGKNDGMLSSETNGGFQPAVTRSRDGRIWYPTMQGLAVIDPATAATNPVPPSVVIEDVTVNGVERPADARIATGPGTSDVSFAYSGVSLTAPDAVTFRYKLEGWDDKWIEAGTRRFASYTRLTPGHYRFLVMAANRDGLWNTNPTELALEVRPHAWETWWFQALVVIAALLLVAAMVRARMRMMQRNAAIEAQNASQKRITAILESITDAFVALDRNWCFTYVNRTAEELLHESRGDLIGRNFWDVYPQAFGAETEINLRAVMTRREPLAFDAADRTKHGKWLGIHAYPTEDGISIYMSDITARKDAEEVLRTQSLLDELTGVYNRRGFLVHAERQRLMAQRSMKPFDVVFIDMDGMKYINDTFGHPVGDAALRDTVTLLQKTFRETDVIGRLGGDEFAVMVTDPGDAGVPLVLERLQQHVDAFNEAAATEYRLSLSVGVGRYDPADPVGLTELLEVADRRMYAAKRGKNANR